MDLNPPLARMTLVDCVDGLLLPVDMGWTAQFVLPPSRLAAETERLHARQPVMASYDAYADAAAEAVLDWAERKTVGVVWMACADLCGTWVQINWAVAMAIEVTRMLHEITVDDVPRTYPRMVPPGLAGLRVTGTDDVDERLLRRVLAVEPWCGYIERLRAQCRRTLTLFDTYDAIDAIKTIETRTAPNGGTDCRAAVGRPPRYPSTAVRRSLRRAIRLYEQRIGGDGLRQFLRGARVDETAGGEMTIRGTYYDYRLKRTESVIKNTAEVSRGIIPFSLTILDKHGAALCSGCVVFDGLPILDQIVALSLHLRNPETEIDVLRRMHMSCPTIAFYQDPLLPELSGLREPLQAPTTLIEKIAASRRGESFAYHKSLMPMAQPLCCEIAGLPAEYLRVLRAAAEHGFIAEHFVIGEPDAVDWLQTMLPVLASAADCLR